MDARGHGIRVRSKSIAVADPGGTSQTFALPRAWSGICSILTEQARSLGWRTSLLRRARMRGSTPLADG
jgi:hypothetical protein